jgi:hypothetical protein
MAIAKLCCRRPRRPAGAAAVSSALEKDIIECDQRLEDAKDRLKQRRDARTGAVWAQYAWPVVVALGLAAAYKLQWLASAHQLPLALALLGVPELLAVGAAKLLGMQAAGAEAEIKATAARRAALIKRIEAELPLKEAEPLLTKYDPGGDHKARGRGTYTRLICLLSIWCCWWCSCWWTGPRRWRRWRGSRRSARSWRPSPTPCWRAWAAPCRAGCPRCGRCWRRTPP